MILVGGLLTGASALAFARGDVRFLRLGYWTLLAVALPGYIVMRIGAQWIYSKEGWDDLPDDAIPAWIDIGYIIADVGALLTLIALILGGIGVRRLRGRQGPGPAEGNDGHLADRARSRSRRRVGDGRQARLAPLGGTALRPEAGLARREANRARVHTTKKKGAAGETWFPPSRNDHGPLNREPAIGRQIQGSPLALQRALQRTSSDFRRKCASGNVTAPRGTSPSPTP